MSFFASLAVLFLLAAAVWRWGTSLARATLRIASVDDDIPTAPLILALISMRASACMYGAAAMCMIAGEVVAMRKDFSSHHDLMTISELGESYDALLLLGGLLVQVVRLTAEGVLLFYPCPPPLA